MTVICLRMLQFSLRLEVLARPELDGAPLVLRAPAGERPLVVDMMPEAAARGVRPGMSLREVSALCPDAVIVAPNPLREWQLFEQLIGRLEEISPLVEPAELGVCYLDPRGLERHYHARDDLIEQLRRAVPAPLRPRVGVAPGRFGSYVAAGQAPPGGVVVVEPPEVAGFLAGLPIDCLPVPAGILKRLRQLGPRRLGDLAALPGSAVQARFGPEGRRAWELASGRDVAEVRPRLREASVVETLLLPAPVTSREMLLVALRQLVTQAFSRPALRHRGARRARLRAAIEDGRSWEHEVVPRAPLDGPRLIEALGHRLRSVELPGPLEALTLQLAGLVDLTAQQPPLLGARPRRARQLVEAVRQLKHRYGVSPIFRVLEVEPWSRIPERRHALVSYDP